jgi:diguanylate cyclase (GGDEF)-like protein
MTATHGQARDAVRRWHLWQAPRVLRSYLLVVDLCALLLVAVPLAELRVSSLRSWGTLALLGATAIAFEEISRRAARLKVRLGPTLRADMTSVWAVAAAVAMKPGMAVLLLAATSTYMWFRQFRPAGEALYRKSATAAMAIVSCLLAGDVYRSVFAATHGLPWLLAGFPAIVAAMATQEVVNRLLVTVALLILHAPVRELLAGADENLVELATLCLGGLVALAVLYQPWLVVLVLAPMYTLQRGALVRELEVAATTDAKTGLLNALAWEHLAERELARSRRERYALTLFLIDIDRFKRVNDEYGHLVGDQVLRRIGRAISAELREYDGVGRFGGEEFVAILPEVDAAAALIIAERLRSRINQLRVSDLVEGLAPDDDQPLSVSIGVSCTDFGGDDVPALLREADVALYRAKETGRNRVVLADGGSSGVPEHAIAG